MEPLGLGMARGPLAQLEEASDSESEGSGFESLVGHEGKVADFGRASP